MAGSVKHKEGFIYDDTEVRALIEDVGDGIIESGSNSNGSYIKFRDGTLICWKDTAWTLPATSPPTTQLAYWTFPVVFAGVTPMIQFSIRDNSGGGAWIDCGYAYSNGVKAWCSFTTCTLGMHPYYASTGGPVYFHGLAIGRWKA